MVSSYLRRGCVAATWLLLGTALDVRADSLAALKSYVEIALQTHPEVQAADANVEAARTKAEALGKPLYNPELGIEGERGQSELYAVGITQTFDFSGKRSARDDSGQALLTQARAEREVQRQRIGLSILDAVTELYGKRKVADLAQQRSTLLQRFADVAEQQYKAGDIGVLDRDLAALAHAEAVAQEGQSELELLKAQQALDIATLNPNLSLPALPDDLPTSDVNVANYETLAQNLPSVRTALAKRDAALADINVARSQAKPDPTLSVRAGREQNRGGGNGEPLAAVQISLPLFVRNNFHAETQAASAQASSARIEATAAYQMALVHMQASAVQYKRSREAWERWNALSSQRIDSGIELLERVWRVREISTAEYVLQLKQFLDGRVAGAELHTQAWHAWFAWLAASGNWTNWLNEAGTAGK